MIELGAGIDKIIGLSDKWHESVIRCASKGKYRSFILKYYGRQKAQPTRDYFLFPRNKYSDRKIDDLFEDVNTYWKICEGQRKGSLDTMIQEGVE